MRVLYLVNSSDFFESHFRVLAQSVLDKGCEVVIVSGDENQKSNFESFGFKFVKINLSRRGTHIFSELCALYAIYKIIREYNPDIVHSLTIKPVIYSGLISRFIRKKGDKINVFSITGFGSASLNVSRRGMLLWYFLKKTYKFIFTSKMTKVIFENIDDRDQFVSSSIVPKYKTFVVNGAGIDTSVYHPVSNCLSEELKVVLVARLLKDKGVREYIDAGKLLKSKGAKIRLQLVGSIDPENISSMSQYEIDSAHKNDFIEYLGHRNDIDRVYQNAHVACLPSYREGLPKSLIEAASCGLAIATSDVPGCRQMVFEGQNGVLFPPKNAEAIAEQLIYLSQNPSLVAKMGAYSRKMALSRFDHSVINAAFSEIYGFD